MVGLGAFARGRRLEQRLLVAPIGAQHRERAYRFFRRRVVGDAGVGEDAARLRHRGFAEPAAHHPVRRRSRERRAGACDVVAAHDRGRGVHEQDCAAFRLGEQRRQRRRVALDRRIADQVDRVGPRPGRRQRRVERAQQVVVERGERHVGAFGRVGRHDAAAAAVGHDRQRVARVATEARQGLRGEEQVGERVHAQHAGAPDRGVEHDVGAGQRPGMRCRRARAASAATRLDDDHRLVACGRARRRHELARRLDRTRCTATPRACARRWRTCRAGRRSRRRCVRRATRGARSRCRATSPSRASPSPVRPTATRMRYRPATHRYGRRSRSGRAAASSARCSWGRVDVAGAAGRRRARPASGPRSSRRSSRSPRACRARQARRRAPARWPAACKAPRGRVPKANRRRARTLAPRRATSASG